MNKLEEFKSFVKQHPNLIDKIQSSEVTWQQLYETYDIYGETHPLFNSNQKKIEMNNPTQKQSQNTKKSPDYVKSAISLFQNIDMDKLSENLQSIKKVIGAIGEITSLNEPKKEVVTPSISKKNTYRRYND